MQLVPTMYRFAHTFFWLSVLVGILPFMLSAIPFSSFSCSGLGNQLSLLCKIGIERSSDFLLPTNTLYYTIILALSLLSAIVCRYWLKFLALAPLAVLVFITVTDSAPREKYLSPDRVKPVSISPATTMSSETARVVSKKDRKTATQFVQQQVVIATNSSKKGSETISEAKPKRNIALTLQKKHSSAELFQDKASSNEDDKESGVPNHGIERPSAPVHDVALGNDFKPTIERASTFHRVIWPLYASASLLGLLLFVSSNSIRSILFLSLPLAISIIIIWTGSFSRIVGVFYATYPVLLVLIIAIVMRLLVLTILQNIDIIANMGFKSTIVNVIKTLSRWWLIAIIAVTALVYSAVFDQIVREAIYCIGGEPQENGQCKEGSGLVTDFKQHPTLEGDINASIDQRFILAKSRINSRIKKAIDDANGSGEAAAKNILNEAYDGPKPIFKGQLWEYDESLKPIDLDCAWVFPDFGCMALETITQVMDTAWKETRKRQRDKLKVNLDELASSGESSVQDNIKYVQARIHQDLDQLSYSIKKAISRVFLAVRTLDLITKLLLIITLIKSFSYVFARFAFSRKSNSYLAMAKSTAGKEESLDTRMISSSGSNYDFPKNATTGFYVNKKFDVSGVPASLACPKPWQALGRRLTNGLFWMNWLGPDSGSTPSIQTSQGAEFIEWQVQANEQVYINPANLVAFSAGMNLRTEISFRMTSLVFGRISFLTVAGPGTLVLKTFGKAALFPSEAYAKSFASQRYVAWSSDSKIAVSSQTGLWNIYFSGIQIAVDDNSRCVVDVAPDGASKGGALGFIPACLLPI